MVAGAAVGAATTDLGLAPLRAFGLTVGMFSGAAQASALSTWSMAATFGPVVVIAILIQLRFVILGASLAMSVGGSMRSRLILAPLLVDPIVVIAQRATNPRDVRRTFVIGGSLTLASWAIGAGAGVAVIGRLPDASFAEFEVVLPALLIAVIAGGVRNEGERRSLVVGGLATAALLLGGLPSWAAVLLGGLSTVVSRHILDTRSLLGDDREPS